MHFSHSIALNEFWQYFELEVNSGNMTTNSKSIHSKREIAENWERDCAKVMKYLSVYCIRNSQSCNEDQSCIVKQSASLLRSLVKEVRHII